MRESEREHDAVFGKREIFSRINHGSMLFMTYRYQSTARQRVHNLFV